MKRIRTHRHYSDAELLSLLDGEQILIRRVRANFHLFRCWECRGKKAELETQAHSFARALHQDDFPGPDSTARARAKFEDWRRTLECPQTVPETTAVARFCKPAWVAGLGLATVVMGVGTVVVITRSARQPVRTAVTSPLLATIGSAPIPAAHPVSQIEHPSPSPPTIAVARKIPSPTKATAPGDALEIDVQYRLHRIGACTAEPVLVSRKIAGPIVVSAVGPPPGREKEIRDALADLEQSGRVRISVTQLNQEPLSADALGIVSQRSQPLSVSLDSAFARSFSSPSEAAQLTNAVLRNVDALYAQAWALRQHSKLRDGSGNAEASAFWLRDIMVREHAVELRRVLKEMRVDLAPVLPTTAANPEHAETDVFDTAGEITAIVHRLSESPVHSNSAAPFSDFQNLSNLMTALEIQLNRLSTRLTHPASSAR